MSYSLPFAMVAAYLTISWFVALITEPVRPPTTPRQTLWWGLRWPWWAVVMISTMCWEIARALWRNEWSNDD